MFGRIKQTLCSNWSLLRKEDAPSVFKRGRTSSFNELWMREEGIARQHIIPGVGGILHDTCGGLKDCFVEANGEPTK